MYGGKQPEVEENKSTVVKDFYQTLENETPDKQQGYSHSSDDSVTGGIFSILMPEPGHHPEDEKPLPRRKKKKKRRYGRQM